MENNAKDNGKKAQAKGKSKGKRQRQKGSGWFFKLFPKTQILLMADAWPLFRASSAVLPAQNPLSKNPFCRRYEHPP